MEPHMNHEDEISVDDTKITPENVKTSTISKDYKALLKLLLNQHQQITLSDYFLHA